MSKEELKAIIALLKSGDFTIAGHDGGVFSLYKGRYKNYDSIPEDTSEEVYIFEDWTNDNGYITEIIDVLVKALGGKTNTI